MAYGGGNELIPDWFAGENMSTNGATVLQERCHSMTTGDLLTAITAHRKNFHDDMLTIMERELASRNVYIDSKELIEDVNAQQENEYINISTPHKTESALMSNPRDKELRPTLGRLIIVPGAGLVFFFLSKIYSIIQNMHSLATVRYYEIREPNLYRLFLETQLAIFLAITMVRFFGLKRNAPGLIIAWLICNMIFPIIMIIMCASYGYTRAISGYAHYLVMTVIVAVIGIYFFESERVKSTFVDL
jgi:hypothetical protein